MVVVCTTMEVSSPPGDQELAYHVINFSLVLNLVGLYFISCFDYPEFISGLITACIALEKEGCIIEVRR